MLFNNAQSALCTWGLHMSSVDSISLRWRFPSSVESVVGNPSILRGDSLPEFGKFKLCFFELSVIIFSQVFSNRLWLNPQMWDLRVTGLPWWLIGRVCLQCRRPRFNPWIRKILWRRKWQPTPVFLPGKSHGERSLMVYGPWGHIQSDEA